MVVSMARNGSGSPRETVLSKGLFSSVWLQGRTRVILGTATTPWPLAVGGQQTLASVSLALGMTSSLLQPRSY